MEMGLGSVCGTSSLKLKHGGVNEEEELGLGLGFVRFSRGLGRKRVGISNEEESLPLDSAINVPLLKRQCSDRIMMMIIDDYHEKSALESLPQDVLIRIICGVDHEDLKQLFNVSKSIREATVIAKQLHFAYSTPRKTKAFRTSIDFEESSELDEIEPPNAPRQWRSHRSINRKKLADISVALFA
ncbi:F-box protein SKIP27-like [Durio zibethinus]|uniref:F-box protein SKIP27-like n=1 Tax=Durio zibethinus TaxID=66656 RepID=A0A6P5X8K7_DURZI|nr:F-box protein SKIP27-like [Durio zibethinus]XP_022724539.1 F-box protein SKIP27-like [Durio zibethinus]